MAKMKQSLMGSGFVETRPKKLGKDSENTRSSAQLLEIKQENVIVAKGDDKDGAISSTSKGTLCNE